MRYLLALALAGLCLAQPAQPAEPAQPLAFWSCTGFVADVSELHATYEIWLDSQYRPIKATFQIVDPDFIVTWQATTRRPWRLTKPEIFAFLYTPPQDIQSHKAAYPLAAELLIDGRPAGRAHGWSEPSSGERFEFEGPDIFGARRVAVRITDAKGRKIDERPVAIPAWAPLKAQIRQAGEDANRKYIASQCSDAIIMN